MNIGTDAPMRIKMGQNLNRTFRKILKGLFDAGIPVVARTDIDFPEIQSALSTIPRSFIALPDSSFPGNNFPGEH